ncbi:MAG: hypothetical protein CW335_01620 [Clostridiales bacterium]|nr:hypothetical protein [Clostridiales bacterium]
MFTKERFQLGLRWVCFGVLLTAVALRMVSAVDLKSLTPEIPSEPPPAMRAEEAFPTMYYSAPSHAATFTAEDAALVDIHNSAGAAFDAGALITAPVQFDCSEDGPLILIVHTHATEAYTVADGDDYSGSYRTTDINYNVVRVGQALTDRLNKNGISTVHDTTLNDEPGYYDAYERTAAVIAGYLEEYPSIQMVIDVHRDAVTLDDGSEMAVPCRLNGEDAAQLMLVMGTNIAGLEHPDWQSNLSMALKIQAHCEKCAPGVFRQMSLRSERYNEHLTPNSILLEVGAAGNTLRQAICSAEYFADRLTEILIP